MELMMLKKRGEDSRSVAMETNQVMSQTASGSSSLAPTAAAAHHLHRRHHHQHPLDLTPLEEIESSQPLKFLLQDWQRQSEGLRQQVQHKEAQCNRSYTDAFTLFMFHLAFQGALLAVVIPNRNILGCHNLWLPMSLSLFAALPLAAAVWHNLSASENLRIQLQEERSILRDLHGNILQLKVNGAKFKLNPGESSYPPPPKNLLFRMSSLGMLAGYSGSILIIFAAFTSVVLVSCYRVLCYPGL